MVQKPDRNLCYLIFTLDVLTIQKEETIDMEKLGIPTRIKAASAIFSAIM